MESMHKFKVLLVDDVVETLELMKIGLGERGYDVDIASSGEAALKLLRTFTPDIIITDLRMQPMNGFDLFHEIKKIARLSNVPFFFLTAVDDNLAKKYGSSLGVDAYITKPTDVTTLDALIRGRLEK
jgi:putative two-component system response regulator